MVIQADEEIHLSRVPEIPGKPHSLPDIPEVAQLSHTFRHAALFLPGIASPLFA